MVEPNRSVGAANPMSIVNYSEEESRAVIICTVAKMSAVASDWEPTAFTA